MEIHMMHYHFREALDIQYDIIHILKSLEEEHQFPKISVELVDNDSSVIYAASKKSAHVSQTQSSNQTLLLAIYRLISFLVTASRFLCPIPTSLSLNF